MTISVRSTFLFSRGPALLRCGAASACGANISQSVSSFGWILRSKLPFAASRVQSVWQSFGATTLPRSYRHTAGIASLRLRTPHACFARLMDGRLTVRVHSPPHPAQRTTPGSVTVARGESTSAATPTTTRRRRRAALAPSHRARACAACALAFPRPLCFGLRGKKTRLTRPELFFSFSFHLQTSQPNLQSPAAKRGERDRRRRSGLNNNALRQGNEDGARASRTFSHSRHRGSVSARVARRSLPSPVLRQAPL